MRVLIWIGILFCLSQSAMFSGLNLACFSISRLRLEIAVRTSPYARRLTNLRRDSNFLLTTILWGNVGVNVLLTILTNSVLAGLGTFIFSTFVITLFGEILPQAYFSRYALRMAAAFAPVLRMYQIILYPCAKPTALLLDRWLGPEGIVYFRERDLRDLLRMHIEARETDIERVEGIGAINFLTLDDLLITEEGENISPDSIIPLPFRNGRPVFPPIRKTADDPMLKRINHARTKWIILIDATSGEPRLALDADAFLRAALLNDSAFRPERYCHRPIFIRDPSTRLGNAITRLRVDPQHPSDDVIDQDLIIFWHDTQRRILTGSDLLGRLLRGIVKNTPV